MKFVFFLILFIIIVFTYKIRKDILHPVLVCNGMWFLLPLLYELLCLTNNRYYILSDKFYIIILSFLIPFSVLTILVIDNMGNSKRRLTCLTSKTHISYIRMLMFFCIFCNFLLIVRILMLCGTFNIAVAITRFRIIVTETPELIARDIRLLLYIYSLTPPLFCYIYLYEIRIYRALFLILIFEFLIIAILYVSKGRLMKYFIMFLALLIMKKRLNFKFFVTSLLLLFFIIIFMTINRDKNFMETYSLSEYVFVYLLSPLPAFDMLVNYKIPFATEPFGSRTLYFFYRIAEKFFGLSLPIYDKMFIMVPANLGNVPTNVFTSFGNFFMDYGYFGCLIYAVIMAISFGYIYRKFVYSSNHDLQIVYALLIYCLVFQFFGDFFFQFLSMTLQDVLCAAIVVRKIKIR